MTTDEQIIDAYNEAGSKAGAAKLLGMPRSTFQGRFKKINESSDFLENASIEQGFPTQEVSSYWVKTDTGSFYVKVNNEFNYTDLRQQFIDDATNYAPKYSELTRPVIGNHLLVIDPADTHFGKLSVRSETGYEYNLKETARRFKKGISALLAKAAPFGIERIAFVVGNDLLHYDTPFRKTTSGTPQDTDGMWHEMFQVAKFAVIEAIEECTQYADVHLVHGPSNHDYELGYALSDSIGSWFAHNPNVNTADCSMSIAHRKYLQYGANLIGFTHGDGAKESDLASLMQFEARKEWAESPFAYWFVHHTHHKDRKIYGGKTQRTEKDFTGVTVIKHSNYTPEQKCIVETVRSPSPPDGWHDRNGYVNLQAFECFLHHVDNGQVARFTEYC